MNETYLLLGKTVERLHNTEIALGQQSQKLRLTIQLLAKLKSGEIKLDWLTVAPELSGFEVSDPSKQEAGKHAVQAAPPKKSTKK